MKNVIRCGLCAALVAAIQLSTISGARAEEKEALKLTLPDATLKGTPEDLPSAPNIDKPQDKAAQFMVPKGCKNVALGKTVTSSVTPFSGQLSQVTDGKKQPVDDDTVEFKKGVQWVQVDLGEPYEIYAIAFWHDHRFIQVMHSVVVQVSNDPEFKKDVVTLFNNDSDNFAGQGVGTDHQYFETKFGKIIDGKGTKARYVRGYTKGSSQGGQNAWQEIEVYALPAK